MPELRMPSLGADMEAATLVAWRCAPGDRVARGDIVAEVETDKGVIEIEAFEGGVVEEILVAPGTRVAVGTSLVRLRASGDAATATAPATAIATAPAAATAPAIGTPPAPALEVPAAAAAPARARMSPHARRRAAELGVDVGALHGSGRDGTITTEDVEHAPRPAAEVVERAAPPAVDDAETRTARMRRAIAASMERSNRDIPHYYVATTIDLKRAMDWLADANTKRGIDARLVPGVLLLKAVALALRRVPELNGSWQDGSVLAHEHVHLGVAVSLRGGGLIAPAIHDADRLDLDALMAALGDVVARARSGGLKSSELSDATCTVTSLGERGVELVLPLIAPPQAAMVGLGRVVERPWVVDGSVVARPLVSATLAGDHRVSDGHRGAAFLVALDALLQEPEKL